MSGPMERLQVLDTVEKDILSVLQSAGQALTELSKEKPSIKQLDNHTSHFLKTLNNIEIELSKHINYLTQVSTGQAHEGSSYASQKVVQMAWHRSEHARTKVMELERNKNQFLTLQSTRMQQRPAIGSAPSTMSTTTPAMTSASTSSTTSSGPVVPASTSSS